MATPAIPARLALLGVALLLCLVVLPAAAVDAQALEHARARAFAEASAARQQRQHRVHHHKIAVDERPSSSSSSTSDPWSALSFKHLGFLPVSRGELFYWFLPQRDGNVSAPLVLWLNGGPGCSSVGMGMFYESGPVRFRVADGVAYENEFAWNREYNVLYIDQPVGTGFARAHNASSLVTSETQMADDVHAALVEWQRRYPAYGVDAGADFYIFGESYAGKYIPTIATRILEEAVLPWRLRGVGIGNGLCDPLVQTDVYADFGYATQLVSYNGKLQLEAMQARARSLILRGAYAEANDVWGNITLLMLEWSGWPNPSDIREYSFPNFTAGNVYLNDPATQQRLGIVPPIKFEQCVGDVSVALANDSMRSIKSLIVDLLDVYDVRVIFYNGIMDMTIPMPDVWIRTIPWQHQQQFLAAERGVWQQPYSAHNDAADDNNDADADADADAGADADNIGARARARARACASGVCAADFPPPFSGITLGTVQHYGNLYSASVANAGHMVGRDNPMAAFNLVKTFISNGVFSPPPTPAPPTEPTPRPPLRR